MREPRRAVSPGIRHTFAKFLAARNLQLLQFVSLFTIFPVYRFICVSLSHQHLILVNP